MPSKAKKSKPSSFGHRYGWPNRGFYALSLSEYFGFLLNFSERILAPNRWFWPLVVGSFLFLIPISSKDFAPLRHSVAESGYKALAHGFSFLGLGLTKVTLVNDTSLSDAEVEAVMALGDIESIVLIDGEALRRRLEDHPRIRSASVHKLLPNGLKVEIKERLALARWQHKGMFYIIDQDGQVIEDAVRFSDYNLPLIIGDSANLNGSELLAYLEAYPKLRKALKYASYIAERRWDLQLSSGSKVLLPAVNLDRGLGLVNQLLETTDLERQKPAKIDVRLHDRLIISKHSIHARAVEG